MGRSVPIQVLFALQSSAAVLTNEGAFGPMHGQVSFDGFPVVEKSVALRATE